MNSLREKLDELLRQGTDKARVELYHWELTRGGPRAKLVVYIDTPQGVTLDDCERTSRAIEALLDVQDPIASPYVLEVSSPGIERRLWTPEHFRRAVGKRVKVVLKVPRGKKSVLIGRLQGAFEEGIELDAEGELHRIPFPEITRAQVVYEPEREGG
ncbi:ribosome maturation factor RimP [Candidatus Acetothermia bacterium]|nr:MAG: ribosome maturation factor RimP [Candidatus Acetothermia bacterium]